ncbi:MAG: metallophosphoesterase [Nitrospinae bacterium]|nr:metallophosphoesterase [Nitrospinota bacterium]
MDRRDFLKKTGVSACAMAFANPLSFISMTGGDGKPFTFAYISDSHINQVSGSTFTETFDNGLKKAVADLDFADIEPDFVFYGGDLAQFGKKEELDHGMGMLSKTRHKIRAIMGEHDFYLDMGEYWRSLFGPDHYSFEHKGVKFIAINSILTYEKWINQWKTPQERMKNMAQLDNPNGSPFMVGSEQLKWMKVELEKVSPSTPVVVFSHSPLYKYYKPWNFWTDDAEEAQKILSRFKNVTVIHGHTHQVLVNQIGPIRFFGVMSTAWPWPYPDSRRVPKLTIPMNRANPFKSTDGCGWGWVNVAGGLPSKHYELWENKPVNIGPDMKPREASRTDLARQRY